MKRATRAWIGAYALAVAAFLAGVATYYHSPYGFTAFIEFPAASHQDELPAVREAPHFDHPNSGGYDGQFYAQFAVEPLLRDPAIDRAMDLAPFRAHRILFSWTAYALGLGRPEWILKAYALQNVITWLLTAWLLCRWMPPNSFRNFVLWAGTLFSHGLLASVRYAVLDGPSVLLLALAVAATEAGRPWWASIVFGVSGLARETNLLATAVLTKFLNRSPRSWLTTACAFVVALAPIALWLDYLRSVYRARTFVGGDHITTPLSGLLWKIGITARELMHQDLRVLAIATTLCLLALVAQASYVLIVLVRSRGRSPWALAAAPFVLLAVLMHAVVWDGHPGAFTRVLLPVSVGANVLLAQHERAGWWWIVLANLTALGGLMMFVPR